MTTPTIKEVRSKYYNYNFNMKTGFFARWGETYKDDPEFSPIGPEIADIEISTICSGPFGKRCAFCYKNDTSLVEKNMSLKTFKKVFNNINVQKNLCQVALGIGDVDGNPDLIPIMRFIRENNVVPNITVNGAKLDEIFEDKTYAKHFSELCGAISVSNYNDELCFNAVKKLTDLGMEQVNIHQIVASQTIDDCIKLLDKVKEDDRLSKLNAVVFLSYKNKTDYKGLTPLLFFYKYEQMINKALDNKVSIGFDSCGAHKFIDYLSDKPHLRGLEMFAEPCESGLFSVYISVDGHFFPCSFSEGKGNWKIGIDVVNTENFIQDIWFGDRVKEWRFNLMENKRNCPMYKI